MFMIMLVLDDVNHLDSVLEAWHLAGVSGATLTETTGYHRWQARRPHVPARYALGGLVAGGDEGNYTLWTIVPNEEMVRRCLTAAEAVIGDLDRPNTGVLAAWPLALVKGVPLDQAPTAADSGAG